MTGWRAPKRRGDAFERAVAAYLCSHGFPYVERAYGAGRPDDRGDLDGLRGFVVEVKAHRSLDLAGFIDEATAEARASGAVPLVIAKRRGRPVADAYVVLRLCDLPAVLGAVSEEARR
jgi:Holliday junction resolvase